MKRDERRNYGKNRRDMRGAARRTYPVTEGESESYRGNGYRGADYRTPAPRVGAIYQNIPTAERVDGAQQNRGDGAERRSYAAPTARRREEPLATAQAMEENENLLVGRNPIREALKAGRPVEKLLVAQGDLSGAARDIIRLAKESGAVVQTVDRSRLDQIYPAHQGMLAYVAAVDYKSVDDIFAYAAEKGEDPFIVILDGVTDPHNLGAIIRSAECAGAHGVIVPERRAVGLTPSAVKASAGAVEYLPVARVGNLTRTLQTLKERGLWIIAAEARGEKYDAMNLTGPIALVIGSEGEGVSRLVLENCDGCAALPMRGRINSLNASVAAGVLMYEVRRQRG